jgi:nucleotide-binding universal stress UspA family protein
MKEILVPIDFSETTASVLDVAERMARAFGSALRLLHVASPDISYAGFDASPREVRDRQAEELREEHRRLIGMAEALGGRGVPAKALLLEGVPDEEIVAQAKAHDVEFIVMGSHGRSALMQALVGSVSEGVIRHAPCPVTVVPRAGKRG